jgi:ATP-binding protein involved in chromosome partitioning
MNQDHDHQRKPLPGVKDTLAICSGKGGVGKSTLSANLALALFQQGLRVGLLDTDIYGPNIPGMLGLEGRPAVDEGSGRLVPCAAHGLKVLSMGLLVDRGVPVIWRGPMLAKMIDQFLFQVDWGELDVLVLDLPPGTGDVQISLTQSAPLSGALIVTTPSPLAVEDVRRGVQMFRQAGVPLLGLVENMSHFVCPDCGQASPIFGASKGEETARQCQTRFLGRIPLDLRMRACADEGLPVVQAEPGSPASQALRSIAVQIPALLATLQA